MNFLLRLNDMRSSKIEVLTNICVAETEQELLDFLSAEKVEPYESQGPNTLHGPNYTYHKSYRARGPLEWYNTPYNLEESIVSRAKLEETVELYRDVGLCSDNTPEMNQQIEDLYQTRMQNIAHIFQGQITLKQLRENYELKG